MITDQDEVTDIDSTDGTVVATEQDWLKRMEMMQMFQRWSAARKGKHNVARAQRAKSRIAKRKAKR